MTLSQRLKQGFVHLTYMIFFFFHQPKSTFVAWLCILVQDTHDLASHRWPTLLIPVAVPASLWSFTQLEFTGSTLGCHHPTEIREQSPFQLQGIGSKCVSTRPDSRAYDLCNCLGSPAQKDLSSSSSSESPSKRTAFPLYTGSCKSCSQSWCWELWLEAQEGPHWESNTWGRAWRRWGSEPGPSLTYSNELQLSLQYLGQRSPLPGRLRWHS